MKNISIPGIDPDDAAALRRISMQLHSWFERECGTDNGCIERDETTGKTYRAVYPNSGKSYRNPIPDRETGALAAVRTICGELRINFYHQGDPRGCALYVSAEPLTDSNYSRGIACCD